MARFILLDAAMDYFQRLEAYSTTDYAESVGFFTFEYKILYRILFNFLLLNNRLLLNKFIVFVFIFTVGLSLRVAFMILVY
ncbi:hypothetical protein BANRA_00285 [Acinetobacter baumannii]|nr:hypothetical protein BANRA_00285 [Acinetobacter baumannii]